MVGWASGMCRHARAWSKSRITRPARKLAANGVENDEVAAEAAAAHPAMARVAATVGIDRSCLPPDLLEIRWRVIVGRTVSELTNSRLAVVSFWCRGRGIHPAQSHNRLVNAPWTPVYSQSNLTTPSEVWDSLLTIAARIP
jgi:hypothetical protein